MGQRARRLLLNIADGRWYGDPPTGVGEATVFKCRSQGLILTRWNVPKQRTEFRITKKGLRALASA